MYPTSLKAGGIDVFENWNAFSFCFQILFADFTNKPRVLVLQMTKSGANQVRTQSTRHLQNSILWISL